MWQRYKVMWERCEWRPESGQSREGYVVAACPYKLQPRGKPDLCVYTESTFPVSAGPIPRRRGLPRTHWPEWSSAGSTWWRRSRWLRGWCTWWRWKWGPRWWQRWDRWYWSSWRPTSRWNYAGGMATYTKAIPGFGTAHELLDPHHRGWRHRAWLRCQGGSGIYMARSGPQKLDQSSLASQRLWMPRHHRRLHPHGCSGRPTIPHRLELARRISRYWATPWCWGTYPSLLGNLPVGSRHAPGLWHRPRATRVGDPLDWSPNQTMAEWSAPISWRRSTPSQTWILPACSSGRPGNWPRILQPGRPTEDTIIYWGDSWAGWDRREAWERNWHWRSNLLWASQQQQLTHWRGWWVWECIRCFTIFTPSCT